MGRLEVGCSIGNGKQTIRKINLILRLQEIARTKAFGGREVEPPSFVRNQPTVRYFTDVERMSLQRAELSLFQLCHGRMSLLYIPRARCAWLRFVCW